MHFLVNIFFSWLIVLSPGDFSVDGVPFSFTESHTAQLQPEEESDRSFSNPFHPSGLFAIQQPAESGVELSNKTAPQPHFTTEREDNVSTNRSAESLARKQVSISIHDSHRIRPGLSVRSLIFPFHFFL